ncbi:DUF397 domain-containing protein [Streptomyces chryseus]
MEHEGIRWIKSSYSGGSGTECVEVANLGMGVAVRDSKAPDGARIAVASRSWGAFIRAVRE